MSPAVENSRPVVAVVLDSAEYGGAEAAMIDLLPGLTEDFELVVVLGSAAAKQTRRALTRAGSRVFTVEGLGRRPSAAAFGRLLRCLRSLRPALIHSSCPDQTGGVAALLAARALSTPSVLTLHLVSPAGRRLRNRIAIGAQRGAAGAIAVSKHVSQYLNSQGVQSAVIYNAVAVPEPAPEPRAELGLERSDFVVLGLGRLERQKGWDVLCRAAAEVLLELPGARFVVLGDGPEREPLEAELGCSAVIFGGFRADAATLIAGADLMVVPSRWEGFGRVAAEGMMCGVPVIASEVGGLPEVLGPDGVLVPAGDDRALARGIIDLARDPQRRAVLAAAGRERARLLFSLPRQVEETAQLYRQLIAAG